MLFFKHVCECIFSMASNEHLILSDFIKSVHLDLREKSKIMGAEKAWQSHCADEPNLKKYASAMRELASNYWEVNDAKQSKTMSRVQWSYTTCMNYFNCEIFKCQGKEMDVASKLDIDTPVASTYSAEGIDKLKLLDVGSCYNPFKKFECFEVTALDIAPGLDDVFECDFLNLKLGEWVASDKQIFELPKGCFDVVVFSLLLEYLPSPTQRLICCEKAYSLLKSEGLLIIITPDSNHVGVNAKYMKSWRFVLAKMGFSRVKYEKLPHIHCMAFRKSFCKEIPQRWAELHKQQQVYEEIFIPQDFLKTVEVQVKDETNGECLSDDSFDLTSELSYYDVI